MAINEPSGERRDLDTIWPQLESGLDVLLDGQELRQSRYTELYRLAYNHCIDAHLPRIDQRDDGSRSESTGRELYLRLKDYLKRTLARVLENLYGDMAEKHGEELLRFYLTKPFHSFRIPPEPFHQKFKLIGSVFLTLNKYWIKRQIENRRDSVYDVLTLCLVTWRDLLLEKFESRLMEEVFNLIRRDGEEIDRSLIRAVLDSYVELGIDVDAHSTSTRTNNESSNQAVLTAIYWQKLEKRYLDDTKNYYSIKAEELQCNSFTDYMMKIEKDLTDELERCDFYFPSSSNTRQSFIKIWRKFFIQPKIELFQDNFDDLLKEERLDDLARMLRLYHRTAKETDEVESLEELKKKLEGRIIREGRNAIQKIEKTALNSPNEFIEAVLEVHKRYEKPLSQDQDDVASREALDKATKNLVNKNAITELAGNSSSKVPELIARYCDWLLKKSKDNRSEAEMEDRLQNVITIFKYIEDKDVFQQYYTKMFSKRLIGGFSASKTAESQMISELKQMCGFEYTSKLQRMFTDTELSKNITENFRKHCQDKNIELGLDFTVMVLGYSSWPSMPQIQMQMPLKLSQTMEQFTNYYNGQHSRRKLNWVYSQSRGELSSSGFQKKYVFQAWTAQMAVLMLYNEAPRQTLTIAELMSQLDMSKEQLVPVVGSLFKNKLLKSNDVGADGEFENQIADTAVFSLDANFQSKKIKVALTRTQMRSEMKKQAEEDKKCIDEDRRLVIEACIVRIMKTRKRLAHNELISEVDSQLSSRFTPNVMKVRTSIEGLMERLFLKRADDAMNNYEYIA